MVSWMDLSQQCADGSFITAMMKNIHEEYNLQGLFTSSTRLLSAPCLVSTVPQHHWDSTQLPVVLIGALAASCHISQLGELLLRLQPIGLVLRFLAR